MKVRGLNMKKISVVTTSIYPLGWILEYIDNFIKFDVNLSHLTFIIVGDHKTPEVHLDELSDVVEYWSPKAQDKWLKKTFPAKYDLIKDLLIPENDMRRRNFGYLRAKQLDSDIVITVDDDNFPLKDSSWLDLHIEGLTYYNHRIGSKNNIINPCQFLKLNYPGVYSRGYPITKYYSNGNIS